MPPRFAYWTILIDDKPTAFRAQYKEDLQPTFFQLRRTNPNAVMRWFARGKLWDTPEQAQWAARNLQEARAAREKRTREWRPGGEHKDPRARFDKRRPSGPESLRGARPPISSPGGAASAPLALRRARPKLEERRPGAPAPMEKRKAPWRPKSSGAGRDFRPARKDNRGKGKKDRHRG